jgi:hypothetical protein
MGLWLCPNTLQSWQGDDPDRYILGPDYDSDSGVAAPD